MPSMPGMLRSSTSTSASVRADHLEGVGAVGGFGHHLDAGLALEDAPDAAAHQRVIVGEQHPDSIERSRRFSDGNIARRCARRGTGRLPIDSRPPSAVMRSRIPSQPM